MTNFTSRCSKSWPNSSEDAVNICSWIQASNSSASRMYACSRLDNSKLRPRSAANLFSLVRLSWSCSCTFRRVSKKLGINHAGVILRFIDFKIGNLKKQKMTIMFIGRVIFCILKSYTKWYQKHCSIFYICKIWNLLDMNLN